MFSFFLTRRIDFDSGLFRLPDLDTLTLTSDFYVWYGAHGGYDRSAGDAYSSMAPDPTSDIFRGPCTPIIWFVFPIELMRLFPVRYFCHFKKTLLQFKKRWTIESNIVHTHNSESIECHFSHYWECAGNKRYWYNTKLNEMSLNCITTFKKGT
jgi:hypothetical protein